LAGAAGAAASPPKRNRPSVSPTISAPPPTATQARTGDRRRCTAPGRSDPSPAAVTLSGSSEPAPPETAPGGATDADVDAGAGTDGASGTTDGGAGAAAGIDGASSSEANAAAENGAEAAGGGGGGG